MQNNIYNYALKVGEFKIATLCELCDQMDPTFRDRFITALLGIVDMGEIVANLPKTQVVLGREATMKDSNYLFDIVYYEYDEQDTRYFKNEKDAADYRDNGNGYWKSENCASESHPIEASHLFHRESSTSFAHWVTGDNK